MKEENISLIQGTLIFIAVMIVFFCAIVLPIRSVSAQDYPKIVPYVNDFASLLTPTQIDSLNLQADQIEQNTTYEIAIITLYNITTGESEIDYANRIGDQNGVGKKGLSNGVVILWSIQENTMAIATGRGSESIFNDAKVGRIERNVTPECLNNSFYLCFSDTLNQLNSYIKSNDTNSSSLISSSKSSDDSSWLWMFGGFILFLIIVRLSSSGDDDGGSAVGAVAGAVIGSAIGGSSGSSFSGAVNGFGGGGK